MISCVKNYEKYQKKSVFFSIMVSRSRLLRGILLLVIIVMNLCISRSSMSMRASSSSSLIIRQKDSGKKSIDIMEQIESSHRYFSLTSLSIKNTTHFLSGKMLHTSRCVVSSSTVVRCSSMAYLGVFVRLGTSSSLACRCPVYFSITSATRKHFSRITSIYISVMILRL